MRVLFSDVNDKLPILLEVSTAYIDEEWHLWLHAFDGCKYASFRALKKKEFEEIMTKLNQEGYIDIRNILFTDEDYIIAGEDDSLPF